jgi:hypothetical protein
MKETIDFNTSIENLGLSARSLDSLFNESGIKGTLHYRPPIRTLGQLVTTKEIELLTRRKFSRKSLQEIKKILTTRFGLHLGMETLVVPPDDQEPNGMANHRQIEELKSEVVNMAKRLEAIARSQYEMSSHISALQTSLLPTLKAFAEQSKTKTKIFEFFNEELRYAHALALKLEDQLIAQKQRSSKKRK